MLYHSISFFQNSAQIQEDISTSETSLVDWFTNSSCITASGHILVNVTTTDNEILAKHSLETSSKPLLAHPDGGSSQKVFIADVKPPPVCGNLLAQVQPCEEKHESSSFVDESYSAEDTAPKKFNSALEDIARR